MITGGSGFIGKALAGRLVAQAHTVESGRMELADFDAVREAVKTFRPELVYHLAATPFNPPGTTGETHLRVNALGTMALLEALRDLPDTRLVYTGSAAEYGAGSRLREDQPPRPSTLLGAAKACATLLVETYARRYGMRTVILRLFTPYGPGDRPCRLIPYVIRSAAAGGPVRISSGSQQRDFFYIDDLVDALVAAPSAELPNPAVINLCSGEARTVREVVQTTLRLMNADVPVEVGAVPTRSDEIQECSGDNSRAAAWLGWTPRTGLEQGLAATIRWHQEHRR